MPALRGVKLLSPRAASDSGAGGEAIMSIPGYVSLAMLSRYSRVLTEAKRRPCGPSLIRNPARTFDFPEA